MNQEQVQVKTHFGEFPISKETFDSTILLGYRGSIAHDMHVPSNDPDSIDDVDLMGIVVPDKSYYLGLREYGSHGTKEVKQGQWDVVFYEARKMISLLSKGNPNVLSLLWTTDPEYIINTNAGRLLIENRELFLTKAMFEPWAGYANGQLQRMNRFGAKERDRLTSLEAEVERRKLYGHGTHDHPYGHMHDDQLAALIETERQKYFSGYMGEKRKELVVRHGYDTKNAAHLIRLLRMGIEAFDRGQLQVARTGDRDSLLGIKRGTWSLEGVQNYAAELFTMLREARDRSTLPDEPDMDRINDLCVRVVQLAWEERR